MRFIFLQTFRILLREKILFNIFGITLLLLLFGYLASLLVYGSQDRVMQDLGLMVNAISIFGVASSLGARLMRQEIESKSIYLLLTRPISRTTFFMGRFLGMLFFVALNFSILSFILALYVKYIGGTFSLAFLQSATLTLIEAGVLLALSQLLSFWLRPGLVLMMVFAFVFLGHNHDLIQSLQLNPATNSPLFSFLSSVVPRFNLFLMADRVFYEESLSVQEISKVAAYGMIWIFMFLITGNAVFSRKNL